MADVLEVQYTLTEEDLRSFLRRIVWRSGVLRVTVVLFAVLAGLFALLAFRNSHRPAPFIILTVAFAFIAYWLTRSDVRQLRLLRRNRDLRLSLLPQTLTLSTEGVGDASRLGRSFFEWRAVETIDETPRFAALMLSGIRGYIVPRRAFATEADYVRFIETAKRLKREAEERHSAAPEKACAGQASA